MLPLHRPRRSKLRSKTSPLGRRVLTKNPRPWEFDDSLPEPVQETWAKISLTVEREDGGIVDAEQIRPRSWIESNGIGAGQLLPLNIAERQVAGFAHVTAVDPCPMISSGEGSVITGRFTTRQVDIIARAEILGADGTIEILEGTTTHPIWSLDRQDWVELGELAEGEQLSGQAGIAVVISHAIHRCSTPVYNIEVHGEHVYQVGCQALLVHNAVTCGFGDIGSHLPVRASTALENGLTWLGGAYDEIASGIFRSKDKLRQFRMTDRDLLPTQGNIGPHVHFEALDSFGNVIENLHIPVI